MCCFNLKIKPVLKPARLFTYSKKKVNYFGHIQEKEKDLELAAKIGQELLERNRTLDDKVKIIQIFMFCHHARFSADSFYSDFESDKHIFFSFVGKCVIELILIMFLIICLLLDHKIVFHCLVTIITTWFRLTVLKLSWLDTRSSSFNLNMR